MSDREQKNETVDDVLAEMVRESIIHVYIPATDLERYINRIKATWKRERAKVEADALTVGGIVEVARTAEKSSAVGNAAEMREALENSNGLLEELAAIGEWGESAREQIAENNAALAAPARNCDRSADELDAQLAFLNEVWLISVDRETMLALDKYENWSDEMRTRYGKWLLAPAAERKGEGDYA